MSEKFCSFDIIDALLIDTAKIVIIVKVTKRGPQNNSQKLQKSDSNKSMNDPLKEGPSGSESPSEKISYKIQVWEIKKEGFG